MAKQGYFPPQSRRQGQKQARKPIMRKADPYTLDQKRENPDVTEYDRSPEAIEHEMPDTRTEWRNDERTPVGLPSPSPQMVGSKDKRPRLNPKEARRIEAHAGRALRIAKATIPAAAFKHLSVAGREDLLMRQASDLMGLSDQCVQRIMARIDKLNSFAASFNRRALDPMNPGEPMEAPAEDMMDGMDEGMGEAPEQDLGAELEPEVKEYIDHAVEEAVEEAVGETDLGEDMDDLGEDMSDLGEDMGEGSEELELAPAEEGMEEMSSLEMPSDADLLGLLDDRSASRRRQARDPGHWEDSVMDVEKPGDDYHAQSADYYESGSNSEKFEQQMDLSNPALDKGASRRRRQTPRGRRADGETQNPDPGGLNPFDADEDYHDADSHSYQEKPMSIKFEEQVDLSNPVLDKGGQHPRESSYNEDSVLNQLFVESMRKDRIAVDAYGNLDTSVMGTSVGTESRGADGGPTVLADFVQSRREIDASNVMSDGSAPRSRVASRQPSQRRRAPAPQRAPQQGRQMRRQAAQRPAPQKAGVRSVGNLGRRASVNPQREIDALSAMWKSEPDVSKVFG